MQIRLASFGILLTLFPMGACAAEKQDSARAAGIVANPQLAWLVPDAAKTKLTRTAPAQEDDTFWWKPQRQKAAAAAQLVLARNPITIAAMRIHGHRMIVWGEQEFVSDKAPPLNSAWLSKVTDGTAFEDYRAGKWREVPRWELPEEYKAYNDALVKSFATPLEAFKDSAKDNSDLAFVHLHSEPWKYRGAVIELKGRLRRLRKFDAPVLAREEGVRHLYEGWIIGPTHGSLPICVIFPILPNGLKVGEDVDMRVSFYGYFFKKYRYFSGEQYRTKEGDVRNRQRETLLLIGPTLVAESGQLTLADRIPVVTRETGQLAAIVIGIAVFVAILVLIMSLIYRRSDNRIQKQIDEIRMGKSSTEFTNEENAPNGTFSELDKQNNLFE